VIDHGKPMAEQLQQLGVGPAHYIASLTHTDSHYVQLVEALAPQGHFALIDDPATLDALPLKRKSASLHWELMFTRSIFETEDMQRQHDILERVAALVDSGVVKTTMGEHYGTINAQNMRRAHAMQESGKARGKIVLEGF
jgi:NADPH:quinone reductase-like Zn-dependent oxidoreductase